MIGGVIAGQMRKASGGAVNTVSYVGVSATRWATATSITETVPASSVVGDLLIAIFMHRVAATAPSGWALVRSQTITSGVTAQILSVYSKVALAGDPAASMTFEQASSQRTSLTLVVLRGSISSPVVLSSAASTTSASATVPVAAVGPAAQGNMLVAAATTILAVGAGTATFVVPGGLTQVTSSASTDAANQLRTCVGYKSLVAGESASGAFAMNGDPTGNGMSSISVLVG